MSVVVFAYGSNMSTARLKRRAGSARRISTGLLREHELRFHKCGVDGSAKANAFQTGNPSDVVHGVLFEIDERDLPALDRAEARYQRSPMSIECDTGGRLTAEVYRALPEAIDEGLAPFDWYLKLVVDGAREHGLPDEYCTRLLGVHAVPDSRSLPPAG